MSNIRVRKAIIDDVPAMARAMQKSFEASYARFMPLEYVLCWESAGVPLKTVQAGLDCAAVAELDGWIEGYTSVEFDFLAELWVAPRAQGRGVGQALIHWAEKQISDAGYSTMHLHCYRRNKRARAFYQGQGFTQTDEYPSRRIPGGPVTVLVLSRPIPNSEHTES